MPRHDRPALLTPDERTRRVAALLAIGLVLPLTTRFLATPSPAEVARFHPERACYLARYERRWTRC
jgi:hypothetical protein